MTGSDVTGTGNHMTRSDVTGSALNRKSRVLGWETAEQYEKSIVGSEWVKTAEKKRAQSPKSNLSIGGDPWTPKNKKNNKNNKKIK